MSIQLLEQIGLSEDQAKVYSCLVGHEHLPARKIGLETGVNRSLVYKVIKELIALGLVIEHAEGRSISRFSALHPSKLQSIIDRKKTDLKLADQALAETIGALGAQFSLTCGKPTVLFHEGAEGLKMLHSDIVRTKADIRLIRSPLDNNTDEVKPLTSKNREEMREAGIHIKLIVPIKNTPSSISAEEDAKYLVERRRVPRSELLNPAQVVIYGSKVALTSFNDCMITTIIEDKSIAETMAMLFDILWNKYSGQ